MRGTARGETGMCPEELADQLLRLGELSRLLVAKRLPTPGPIALGRLGPSNPMILREVLVDPNGVSPALCLLVGARHFQRPLGRIGVPGEASHVLAVGLDGPVGLSQRVPPQ